MNGWMDGVLVYGYMYCTYVSSSSDLKQQETRDAHRPIVLL
jgi:hypothetical protein